MGEGEGKEEGRRQTFKDDAERALSDFPADTIMDSDDVGSGGGMGLGGHWKEGMKGEES